MKAGEQNKGQLLRRTATPAGPTILRTSTCNTIVIDRGFFYNENHKKPAKVSHQGRVAI